MNWTQVFQNLFTLSIYGILGLFSYVIFKVLTACKEQKNLENKFVVVTGGSSGIGKCVAIIAAQKGANVAIIARDSEKLEAAKTAVMSARKNGEKQRVECVSLDITINYDDIEKKFDELEENFGPIHMLINCAGFAECGKIENVSPKTIEKLMGANFISTYFCTKAVVPKMKREKEGTIVLVSSLAGLAGIFGYTAYSSSKFALKGLAESLAMEITPYNISVTLCTPPDTDTPGFANELLSKPLECKLISETAGLEKPEIVAKRLMDDALAGKFFSTTGMEGFILTTLTSGMSPYSSFGELLIQAFLMGPLRIISAGYLYYFNRIINKCMKEREDHKKS